MEKLNNLLENIKKYQNTHHLDLKTATTEFLEMAISQEDKNINLNKRQENYLKSNEKNFKNLPNEYFLKKFLNDFQPINFPENYNLKAELTHLYIEANNVLSHNGNLGFETEAQLTAEEKNLSVNVTFPVNKKFGISPIFALKNTIPTSDKIPSNARTEMGLAINYAPIKQLMFTTSLSSDSLLQSSIELGASYNLKQSLSVSVKADHIFNKLTPLPENYRELERKPFNELTVNIEALNILPLENLNSFSLGVFAGTSGTIGANITYNLGGGTKRNIPNSR